VIFDRGEVREGTQDETYQQFNVRGNGFSTVQSHPLAHAVVTYVWTEEVNNSTGHPLPPVTREELVKNGKAFGMRALFDCVAALQGDENWWWELSRRCRLQEEDGTPVSSERACTLEWRDNASGWRRNYPRAGEKASSAAFEAWFDALRCQIALNLFKMGIFGTHAESFLHKVRLCHARREPYRYSSVSTVVEGVPVIYLGDSAGSTDFKKGISCGRGLLCACQLALDVCRAHSLGADGAAGIWRGALQRGAERYQQHWASPEMVAEWSKNFDASFKYLQHGRDLRGLQMG
jgi:hypothetical protein